LPDRLEFKPTNWDAVGCSYRYNVGINTIAQNPAETRLPEDSPDDGIAGQDPDWVPQPSLYILLHEPPAKRWTFGTENSYVHWHYARGPSDISQQQLKTDGQKFISTILFVDGHAAKHDFTFRIKGNPRDTYEQTKDWIWYKPAAKDQ